MPRTPVRAPDAGFTMIEVVTALGVSALLMAVAAMGFDQWAAGASHRGKATELEGVLRLAQQRAVTEGRSACVLFSPTADTWTVYRGACSAGDKELLDGPVALGDRLDLTTADFDGSPSEGVTFSSRGTATAGTVGIGRDGASKVWTVRVEGLTGRVTVG